MADTVRKTQYFKVRVPDKPGVCARALDTLRKARVNLLAFSGFPRGSGAQLDFVPSNPAKFKAAARRAKLNVVGPKTCFVASGKDRPGAVAALVARLGEKRINITAVDAACGGAGRYGAILWVKERDVKRASKALGIR